MDNSVGQSGPDGIGAMPRGTSLDLLNAISQHSPLGIYIAQDNRIKYANPAFQKITGHSETELSDKPIGEFVAPEDVDVFKASVISALEGREPYPAEFRIPARSGPPRWVMQTISPISYRGRPAVLGNIMDISERKYLERKVIEYEELSKLKSNLLATVSHELRTPLATIKGYATLILDYYARLTSEETRDYLKSIDQATDRLAKLVDNLLDTSRLEAGLLRLKKSPTSLLRLIREVAEEANVRTGTRRVEVGPHRESGRVPLDSRRIRQVLDNLVDNAIKYSPPASTVTLAARQNGKEVLVSVTDRGQGIPPGELKSIFDRMYRADRRLYSGSEGIGLGLYLCQRLVEAHGGHIWAESREGKGTTIYFTLPSNGTAITKKAGLQKSLVNPSTVG